MASSRRYDQEIRFDGRNEDDDQDEVEIYSVSGRRSRRGADRRGMQASRFGATDEDIELQLHPNQNSVKRVKSTHELGPSAYQTAMEQRNPSGSQERAEELDEAMERLLELVGFGKLQWLMLIVCGWGMVYGSVQLGFIGYLLPDIARDLCLTDESTGWLRGSVFIGVIFVSIIWGCAADLGSRRKTLSVCLIISGVSTAMAACFARSHTALLVFLVIASLGTGGVISIPFAYLTEFVPRRIAHKTVCALLTFTVIGAMLTPIVTTTFASSLTDGDFARSPFANWRIFCLVTSLFPVVSAVLLPTLLPDSPYLLAEKRKWTETIQVLTQAYSYNRGNSHLEMFKDRANGLYLLKRHTRDRQSFAPSTKLQKCARKLYLGCKNITSLMDKNAFILATSAFAFAFGYCSWTLWLSDFITAEGISSNASVSANSILSDETIGGTLQTHFFINTTFQNVSFSSILLRGVSYTDCSFVGGSSFERVVSEATSFNRCTFVSTVFTDTDLQPRQFVSSEFVNASFRGTGKGCAVDVPFAPVTAYWQIMFGHSGGLLGLLLSVFITRLIDTRLLFMYGTLVTAVTIVFGFFPLTGWTAAVRQFVLQFGGFASCSALIVQVLLSFPTHKKVTCLGLVLSVVTTGGLLGFMAVVVLPQVADVIVTASLLLVGVLCSCCFQRHSLE
ncbi:synaptic vesicle glycoprotein 2B-like [Asterias amurensis]|uniref:synaptic vesicle glycoprotein 2B-like n=1 Tax=Asterias amurensis TaxID=7602 RepID=UPI003AB74799